MPPKRYPNFRRVPHTLSEKRELKIANDFRRTYITHVEQYDFLDETTPIEPTKTHYGRKFWETRTDYLFMLVFSNLSLYDALACAELTIRLGGYVIIIYILLTITVTLVCSYLVIFISVYTKKSMLNFGSMIPLFSGFAYILLGLCLVRAIMKMRLFMNFSLFAYHSITTNFTVCPSNPSYKKVESHLYNVSCVSVGDEEQVREMHHNSTCTVLPRSLALTCNSSDRYVLSTHVLPSVLFYNIQSKYLSLVLACIAYGIMVFLLLKEMPSFVKGAEAATILFFALNIFVIASSFFMKGHEKGVNHIFQVLKWPDAKALFTTIIFALPKLPEIFLTSCAATGRLPLCTTPAIDSVIVVVTQVFMTVAVSGSNILMMGVLSHNLNISVNELGPELVPFISAPYFMAAMPVSEKFWTVFYFFGHSVFCFYGVLTLFEAIFVNVLWYHGMNKLIITVLHVISFFMVLYFYLLPDEDDINGWVLINSSINLPVLVIFCSAIFMYGIFKLEEDISFMTSSPPAELMSRLTRVLPFFSVALLIWGRGYVADAFDNLVMYFIVFWVFIEAVLRLLLSNDPDAVLRPKSCYGPPNITLRAERKDYALEMKRVATSNANRALYLFNKAVARDKAITY